MLSRYDLVEIETHYVPANVLIDSQTVRDEDLLDILMDQKRIIIEGTAGLGKTLFVKSLFRQVAIESRDRIPIFFELRNLQIGDRNETIISHLVRQISYYIPTFTEEHLCFGLEEGRFAIFLDGMDEIPLESRTRYSEEILDLSHRYLAAPILATTRPDTFYQVWYFFSIAKLLPMKRSQATLMLSKLDFDPTVKSRFIGRLSEEFFDLHHEFLSVPLLCILMLMSYNEFADVPSKIYIFYEQAFQTLFHKHDAIKGAFSRRVESGLDIQEFRKILSIFCFISYTSERFSFLQHELIEDIKASIELSDVDADPDMYFSDLLITVNLMQIDGNYVTFIHRSFQEYFAALFVIESKSLNFLDFVDRLMLRSGVDSVISMIMQLGRETMENGWVLPKINEWGFALQSIESDYELLKTAFGEMYFDFSILFSRQGLIPYQSFIFILKEYCPNMLDSRYSSDDGDRELIQKYVNDLPKKERNDLSFPFVLTKMPTELVNSLGSVRLWASFIRSLWRVEDALRAKEKARSLTLRRLVIKHLNKPRDQQ